MATSAPHPTQDAVEPRPVRPRRLLTGGQATAEAMRQIDPDVVPVYPITPQTPIIETFAQFVADGRVHTELMLMESEHSAMSAAVGSALAGGRTITATASQGLAYMIEVVYIAASLRAGASPRHWAEPARAWDAFDAKADALAVLAALGLAPESLTVTAEAPDHYHPGRSGALRQGPKTVLATFGELHPRLCAAFELSPPVAACEVFLDAIPAPRRRRRAAPDLPALQPLRRDFAFLLDAEIPAEAVLRAARGAERALIAGVTLFDLYAGEKLPPGKKSLAIEVTLQPRAQALTDAEIEAASARIIAAVVQATGASLR